MMFHLYTKVTACEIKESKSGEAIKIVVTETLMDFGTNFFFHALKKEMSIIKSRAAIIYHDIDISQFCITIW